MSKKQPGHNYFEGKFTEQVPHNSTPVIDNETYEKVQEIIKENNNMSKTTTTIQYAVFIKRKDDAEWHQLNRLFYDRSETLAKRRIEEHKNSFEGQRWPFEYKIMVREVMIGEWIEETDAYVRTSNQEQHDLSIEAQKKNLEEYAEQHNKKEAQV